MLITCRLKSPKAETTELHHILVVLKKINIVIYPGTPFSSCLTKSNKLHVISAVSNYVLNMTFSWMRFWFLQIYANLLIVRTNDLSNINVENISVVSYIVITTRVFY